MTTIMINDDKLKDLNLKEDNTLKELQGLVVERLNNNDHVISEIIINKNRLEEQDEEATLNQNISNFDSIEFKSKPRVLIAFETLESCETYINELHARIHELTALYRANKVDEANALFVEVTTILDLFIQLMTKIQNIFSQNFEFKKDEQTLQLELNLLEVLKQLVPARQNNDMIMLCDLLEYELVANLDQWKSQVIPSLRSLKK
ncbi:MAG: hypothetical protein ACO20H_00700 [Bacteriovoracaceae bacterium]